jgi:hypothetical protein
MISFVSILAYNMQMIFMSSEETGCAMELELGGGTPSLIIVFSA